MSRENLAHLPINLFFLKAELALIFINALLSLLAILFLFNANQTFQHNINNVYVFVNNNRIIPDSFLTDLYIIDNVKSHELFGQDLCPKNFEYHSFFDLKKMENTDLTDVTDTIRVVDMDYRAEHNKKLKLANPAYLNAKFYEIDIHKTGNKSIEFMNTISLYSFKNYNFCKKKVYFDQEYSNIRLIKKNETCDSINDNYSKMINCGIVQEHYKICVDRTKGKINNRQLNNDLSKLKDLDFCPLTDISVKFKENPSYEDNHDLNKYLALFAYTKNNTVYTWNTFPESLMPYEMGRNEYDGIGFNADLIETRKNPRNLIMNFEESITFNNFYDLENNTDLYNKTKLFLYSNPLEIRNIKIGEKYGYRDSYTRLIDSQDFYSFYNSTNFMGSFNYTENGQNYTSFLPFAMKSLDAKSYYIPKKPFFKNKTEQKNDEIHISLYEMKPFDKECYDKVFEQNKRNDALRYLNQINIDILSEVIPTLIAWFMIVFFIQFWGFIKIRASYLTDVLNFRVKECDIKSEKITKYTFKTFLFLAFIIILKGVLLEGNRATSIVENSQLLIKNDCFPNPHVKHNFKHMEDIATKINFKFSKVRMIFYFLIFTEILTILVYIKNNNNDYKPINLDEIAIAEKHVKIQ